jgi:hypothetical protein
MQQSRTRREDAHASWVLDAKIKDEKRSWLI